MSSNFPLPHIASTVKISNSSLHANLNILRESMAFTSYSRLSEISLYFEKTWTKERIFTIEDCLKQIDDEERKELFALLLEIDLSKGFISHSVIPIEEYYRRFPQWKDVIDETFAQFNQQSISGYGKLGTKIAHYHIHEVLGKGAMGIVFKATDEILLRTVAVKYILPQKNTTPEAQKKIIELFCNEVAMLGQLKRDTMFVQAYDSNWDGDFLYLAMEYVDGEDLAKYVQKKGGKLPFHEALTYIRQITEGLCEIHDLGIIHRDIKPENVIRNQYGTIRILDLGLGVFKDSHAAERLLNQVNSAENSLSNSALILDTETNKAMAAGTPAYWSPEAYYTPEAIDPRSDLFSLGGTFFFLLTGILPVKWRNPITSQKDSEPVPLKNFLPNHGVHIPQEGLVILEKLLELNPDDRFSSAAELLTALRELEEKITPKPWYLRWKGLIQASAVMLLLALSICLFSFFQHLKTNYQKLETAQSLYKNQKCDAALKLLVDLKPEAFTTKDQIQLLELRSTLYRSEGKKEHLLSAKKDVETLMKLAPENLEYQSRYIRLMLDLNEMKEARNAVIQIQKKFPNEVRFQILDAEILIETTEKTEISEEKKMENLLIALDILEEIVGLNPPWEAYFWRAKIYYALNDIDFALKDLEALMKISKDVPTAWMLKADLHMAEKNYPKALECWEYIIQRIPNLSPREWADIYLKQAQAFFCLKHYEVCIQACSNSEKQYQYMPSQLLPSQLLQMRAESAFLTQKWEEAALDLRTLLSRNTDTIFSSSELLAYYTMFAFSMLQMGQNEKDKEQQKIYLNECVNIINSCRKRFPNQRQFTFFDTTWSLKDIYLQANLELGNNKQIREDADALFNEMLNVETVSNATLE